MQTNSSLKKQIYVYAPKAIPRIDMKCGEWIVWEKVDFELEEKLKEGQYRCVFMKEQNIFAHYMNRLRSLLKATDTIAVIGVDELLGILNNAQICSLDIANNTILIDGENICLDAMDMYRNVSEIMEYNLDTAEICYKPDYYYDEGLADIIVRGYNNVSKVIHRPHMAIFRSDKRIWSSGFVFPSDFLELFSDNRNSYFEIMEQYCRILCLLLLACEEELSSDKLIHYLIPHYTYSIIFSLIAPNIVTKMEKQDIIRAIDAVSENTPFQQKKYTDNMRNILQKSLVKLGLYLKNLKEGVDITESYQKIYKTGNFPNNPLVAMLFVTNLLQDIRRGVITEVRKKYLWFDSICGHRKQQNNIFERV